MYSIEIFDDIFKHCWCLDVSFVPPLNSNEADMSGILSTRNICQKPQTVNHTGHSVSSCFCSYRILDFPQFEYRRIYRCKCMSCYISLDPFTYVQNVHSHYYSVPLSLWLAFCAFKKENTFVFYPTVCDKQVSPDVLCYNAMLSALEKAEQWSLALELFSTFSSARRSNGRLLRFFRVLKKDGNRPRSSLKQDMQKIFLKIILV